MKKLRHCHPMCEPARRDTAMYAYMYNVATGEDNAGDTTHRELQRHGGRTPRHEQQRSRRHSLFGSSTCHWWQKVIADPYMTFGSQHLVVHWLTWPWTMLEAQPTQWTVVVTGSSLIVRAVAPRQAKQCIFWSAVVVRQSNPWNCWNYKYNT